LDDYYKVMIMLIIVIKRFQVLFLLGYIIIVVIRIDLVNND